VNFHYQLSAALIGAAIVLVQPQSAVPQALNEKAIAAMAKSVPLGSNGQNMTVKPWVLNLTVKP
jgi:hypothetical protein